MVLTSGEECAPPGHPEFSSDPESAFYAAAFEVYQTGLTLTDEQRTIAVCGCRRLLRIQLGREIPR